MQNNNELTQNKSNLIIYQKYIELIYYTNDILKGYPKYETFALTREIKTSLYGSFRLLMYAINSYHQQEKLDYLNKLNMSLNLFKLQIKLSYQYKYITMPSYQTWSSLIVNVSNMAKYNFLHTKKH